MIIELTHELKVKLLEAIKEGKLDLSILPMPFEDLTDEELAMELIRPYTFEDRDYIFKKANILLEYAKGELTTDKFEKEMLKLELEYWH